MNYGLGGLLGLHGLLLSNENIMKLKTINYILFAIFILWFLIYWFNHFLLDKLYITPEGHNYFLEHYSTAFSLSFIVPILLGAYLLFSKINIWFKIIILIPLLILIRFEFYIIISYGIDFELH